MMFVRGTLLPTAVRIVATLAALCIAVLPVRGQWMNNIQFEQLRVEDGLSQGTVLAVVQDRQGYLWFGTADGLNRYDGYNFIVYRPDTDDSASIGNGRIVALAVDSSNTLWIGTDDGLFSRNPYSGRFTRHSTRFESRVSIHRDGIADLHIDGSGSIWVATHGNGLHRYNPRERTWRQFRHLRTDTTSIGSDDVYSITGYQDRYLWLTTYGAGVDLFDMRTGDSRTIRPPVANGLDSKVTVAAMEGDSALWVATQEGHILRLLIRGMRWTEYTRTYRHFRGKDFEKPLKMLFDSYGRMWCGSDAAGVVVLYPGSGRAHRLLHQTGRDGSIGTDGIRAIMEDRSGTVWLGINGRGLSYTAPSIKPFGLIQERGLGPYSLTFESIRAIHADSDRNIWIGGYGGLNLVDPDRRVTAVPAFSDDFGKRNATPRLNRNIYSIHPHPRRPDALLLGTEGDGLYTFDKRSFAVTRIPSSAQDRPNHIRGLIVSSMATLTDGSTWVGTELGISILHTNGKDIGYILVSPLVKESGSPDLVRAIHQARNGWVWVGLDRSGVVMVDPHHGHGTVFKHHPEDTTTIADNTVYCIHEDTRGILWMGTGRGLSAYDPDHGRFVNYSTREGLPNNVVYGILEDGDGYLWLSTNFGLARFHPKHGVTATYDAEDGLQGNEFNAAAFQKTPDGELYFGGVAGVTHFRPRGIRKNMYRPPLVITQCRIGKAAPGHSISSGDTLVLPASSNQLYLAFAALNFIRGRENQYRYRIKELHSGWLDLGIDRDLTLVGLPPGWYTLLIQGSNNEGLWNPESLMLFIEVRPAIYETVWFRILGLLMLAAAGIGIFRWRSTTHRSQERRLALLVDERTARLTQANAQLMKEIEHRRRAEEEAWRANAVKSEFLAHMSHEIRTPMNAILGFTELLQDKILEGNLRDYLDSIAISGNTLLQLINDILDLSRIEAGRVELVYQHTDVRAIVKEVSRIFDWNMRKRNLEFIEWIDPALPALLLIDDVRLRQILLNLIGNAVKFTERGSVSLRIAVLQRNNDTCTVEFAVTDTGSGIPPAIMEKIFEPFQQGPSARDRQTGGTGLGLAITNRLVRIMHGHIDVRSEVGKGSTFRVVFPDVLLASDAEERREMSTLPTVNVHEPGTSEESQSELMSNSGYDPIACEQLLKRISEEALATWEQIRGRFVLQEIERFGRNIQELSEESGCPFFLDWSQRLLREVGSFDMDNLPYTLKEFEQEYRKLQALVHQFDR